MVTSSTLNASILLQIISKNQSKCIHYAAYYIINNNNNNNNNNSSDCDRRDCLNNNDDDKSILTGWLAKFDTPFGQDDDMRMSNPLKLSSWHRDSSDVTSSATKWHPSYIKITINSIKISFKCNKYEGKHYLKNVHVNNVWMG